MLINHKCHDLKHQISAMRAITSPEEREKYLREVEDSVQIYDAIVQTGNEVLDTVLTEKSLFCAANNIKINCIVDGRQMDIFEPVDLYTIFGNALDNAIESVRQLEKQGNADDRCTGLCAPAVFDDQHYESHWEPAGI